MWPTTWRWGRALASALTSRRIRALAAGLVVPVIATACSQAGQASSTSNASVSTTARHWLPPVVNGVPLLALATTAVAAARNNSVRIPQDVQAVVSTQAALYKLIPEVGEDTYPEYVVAMRGRFHCPGECGASVGSEGHVTTSTTATRAVRTETMILEIQVGSSTGPNGMYLGVLTPDISRLGQVYNLDPYIHTLANTNVRAGPLPS